MWGGRKLALGTEQRLLKNRPLSSQRGFADLVGGGKVGSGKQGQSPNQDICVGVF